MYLVLHCIGDDTRLVIPSPVDPSQPLLNLHDSRLTMSPLKSRQLVAKVTSGNCKVSKKVKFENTGVKWSGWAAFQRFRNLRFHSCKLLWPSCLVLGTGMNNSSSDSTWSKMEWISIEWYKIWSMSVLYASLNATLSPKTATDPSGRKVRH
jgi:hypothetical protein